MKQTISLLYQISRPRFWLYTAGPYILGYLASRPQLVAPSWKIILFLLFFIFPANLLIYGINDAFDYETDKHNAKKRGYESLLDPTSRPALITYITLVLIPFIVVLPLVAGRVLLSLGGFLFFSIFYSAPPIRAKGRPLIDMVFNILYVFPGIFAYFLAGGTYISGVVLIAAGCWCMAMHAFSAIPDIESDRAAHLSTTATYLGFRISLVTCGILYTVSALLAYSVLGPISLVLGSAYCAAMIYSYQVPANLFKTYQLFPYINATAGMVITLFLLLNR